MARTDPRPHVRTGREAICPECGERFWLYKSAEKKGKKRCSMACRDSAKRALIYDDKNQKKKCSNCGEWKPFSDYTPSKGSKSGPKSLQAYCRPCTTEMAAEWARKNPSRRAEINRESSIRNKGNKRPPTQEQRERRNAAAREWRKKNREKVLMWNKIRLHRQRAAGDVPSRDGLNYMRCMQDFRCTYCGVLLGLAGSHIHLDHKMPISRGGTNDGSNLQWLCGPCNLKKGVSTHEEYASKVGVYETAPPSIPDRFDVASFIDAMEACDYRSALGLISEATGRSRASDY